MFVAKFSCWVVWDPPGKPSRETACGTSARPFCAAEAASTTNIVSQSHRLLRNLKNSRLAVTPLTRARRGASAGCMVRLPAR